MLRAEDPRFAVRVQLRNFSPSTGAIRYQVLEDVFKSFSDILNVNFENGLVTHESEDDEREEICLIFKNPDTCETGLIDFCENFVASVNSALSDAGDTATQCTVALCNASAFPSKFKLTHSFCLEQVRFGNLLNLTSYLPHFDVKMRSNAMAHLVQELIKGKEELETSMYSAFEHDERLFKIMFPMTQNRRYDGDSVTEHGVVTMKFRYSSFRRIVVFQEGNEPYLIFQLRHPPEMTVSIRNDEDAFFKFRRPYRIQSWLYGARRQESINAIAECPCILLDFRSMDKAIFADLIGRLNRYTHLPIEYRNMDILPVFSVNAYLPLLNDNIAAETKLTANYPVYYLLEALVSRGVLVKDQLLRDAEARDTFIRAVHREVESNEERAIQYLEQMISLIDEVRMVNNLSTIFEAIVESSRTSANAEIDQDRIWMQQGYVKMRKVIVTPTRTILVIPELMMGNRVVRRHGTEGMIRALFRDEDGSKMSSRIGNNLLTNRVKKLLLNGITIAGLSFVQLGSSNSQLRDNGCYFINGNIDQAVAIRKTMGRFNIESIPKMVARMGQCFTQSRLSNVIIQRSEYETIYDYVGGVDAKHCFSDGVGIVSQNFAAQMAKDLRFDESVPSCFQFRFRGFKGVLCVDAQQDAANQYLLSHDKNASKKIKEVNFRESQEKFKGPRENHIEIVKYSAPSAVSLNKPIINILDQISEMQSHSTHTRIVKRIHFFLNQHLHRVVSSLTNESLAMAAMQQFPKIMRFDKFYALDISHEPFFRSMLRAWAKIALRKLTNKMQIAIPSFYGRTMFGVVDDTGLLQCGQVFIRYTVNVNDKLPHRQAERITVTDKVLVTKNPAVVSGDVRVFEAVDVPALRHLSDVIVFPHSGPRPHPDEMAGSDLDGDEYTVIWDDQLFLDYNEPAFDFTPDETRRPQNAQIGDDGPEFQEAMADFFVKYIRQDEIGRIANALLANSDLHGIKSDVCHSIAKKHNESVDFPKTGIEPRSLTVKWIKDAPPEVVTYWPDFMMKPDRLSYKSTRLLGELFRTVESAAYILDDISTETYRNIDADPVFSVDPDQEDEHSDFVREQFAHYTAHIQNMLETYGIASEAELFANSFSSSKGRMNESSFADDLSLYNTAGLIQKRVEETFGKYRAKFFEHFPLGMSYLEDGGGGSRTFALPILGQVCTRPNDQMIHVAKLYYSFAYCSSNENVMLSFAWLVWDILIAIKREHIAANNIELPLDSYGDKLSVFVNQITNSSTYSEIIARVDSNVLHGGTGYWPAIRAYCTAYNGLLSVFQFLVIWKTINQLNVDDDRFLALLITVSNGNVSFDLERCEPFLSTELPDPDQQEADFETTVGGVGRRLINLLAFLASPKMKTMSDTEFLLGTKAIVFSREELLAVHKNAFSTFLRLAMSDHFCFSIEDPFITKMEVEGRRVLVEVPLNMAQQAMSLLREAATARGCTYVSVRKMNNRISQQCIRLSVVAKGSISAVESFYELLSITPGDLPDPKSRFTDMANQVAYRLMKETSGELDSDEVPREVNNNKDECLGNVSESEV